MFDFISKKFSSLFSRLKGSGRIGEKEIASVTDQVEEALLDADVPYEVVETFLSDLKKSIDTAELSKASNPGSRLMKVVHERLLALLQDGSSDSSVPTFAIPSTITVMGLQGAGKTTTLAKFAHALQMQAKKRGKTRRILCGSVDYYRPAAREQLKVLAEQVGIDYYHASSSDPVQAAIEISKHARANGYEYLLLDTAGRLHVDSDMITELKEVVRAVQPKYKVLVLDAMTGQESLQVARTFNDEVGFDGAIMSKCDSDARGGACLAFRALLHKPIWYVGTGEKPADIEAFVPERMVSRLIGMGDLATLLEKADEVIERDEQERVASRMMGGNFTLEDFLSQMDMVGKMGAIQKIARYLPGVPNLSPEMVEKGQQEMKRFRAIICSMTKKERALPSILNGSRRKRIAAGAGVEPQDVNQMLEKFEQSKQFVKMMKKSGALRR